MPHLRTVAALTCAAIAAACGGTEPSNTPPVAAFTVDCDQLACRFSNASTAGDGSITAYAWTFGDSVTSAEASPAHAYAAPGGDFEVTLVVTDDAGTSARATRQLSVSPTNHAPVAAFSATCANLTCSFTDASSDPDAGDSIVSRTWEFGDAATGDGPSPSHTYGAPGGQFTVTLTVTDAHSATATKAQLVSTGPVGATTYERETLHSSAILASRYVIRADGTFDYVEERSSGQRILHGHWKSSSPGRIIPDADIDLDFDGFSSGQLFEGVDAFGSFLMDGHLGVSLTQPMIQAGLEEGIYTSATGGGTSSAPPPQAGQIAFSREGKIYLANTDGSGLVQLSDGPGDGEPAWSPDGGRIAFARGGPDGGIYVVGADGGSPVRRAASGGSPTWSPDGRTVAFSCRVNLDDAICSVGAEEDGSGLDTLLVRRGQLTSPVWSPDGTRIAFSSDWAGFDFLFDIWVVSPGSSEPTRLRAATSATSGVIQQFQPAWSPDGNRIAVAECPWAFDFCSSSVVAVMHADGSGLARIAVASGSAHPTWSPDGQIVAFASGGSIEWVSADGSQRGRIIGNGTSPAWRPGR